MHPSAMALFQIEPPRRWTPWRVVGVVAAQAAGLAVGFVAGVLAMFLLPPFGLFSTPNSAGDRLWGAVAALVAAAALPAGLWVAAAVRRDRRFLVAGLLVAGGVLVLAVAVATST